MNGRLDRISLSVVDDHRLLREGLLAVFRSDPTLIVVAQGATSAEALEIAAKYPCQVMVLDVELDGTPAARTLRALLKIRPALRIVILTMHDDEVLKRELFRAGAVAFLSKAIASAQLIEAIHRVADARPPAPSLLAQLPRGDSGPLSMRELQVLQLLARAMTNAAIAGQLGIAEGTVKRHASNIYIKLQARSRIDAVNRAKRLGLLSDR